MAERLIGREKELDGLTLLLDCIEADSAAALLEGEPGIGKSIVSQQRSNSRGGADL